MTTSEAARILSVSSDTVLKWVRAGKIEAYRTPGGHARIPINAVNELLADRSKMARRASGITQLSSFRYCWEFNSSSDGIDPSCVSCLAYRSRALRCYELREKDGSGTPIHHYCRERCQDCEYYRIVSTVNKSVLIVSPGRKWIDEIVKYAKESGIFVEGATSEYECAVRINAMRPDFVVIDCGFGSARTRRFYRHISEDNRLPMTRIILASRTARSREYCDEEIFGWISKPFSFEQLRSMIHSVK
ncbi:MAG: helix-turn-helix domain-containing protein [Candidatus Zixiibacteriota bacterium]